MKMANRYIELIDKYQSMLERDLTIEEIQFIKWIVAKEFNHNADCSSISFNKRLTNEVPVLTGIM